MILTDFQKNSCTIFYLRYTRDMNTALLSSGIHLALLVGLLVSLIIFGYFSWTLTHHWAMYNFHTALKKTVLRIYFVASIITLLTLVFFIGIYFFGI